MAKNKMGIDIVLDFFSDDASLDKINKQFDAIFKKIEVELDPKSLQAAKKQLTNLQEVVSKSVNPLTNKVNPKALSGNIINHETLGTAKEIDETLKSFGVNASSSMKRVTKESELFGKSLGQSNKFLDKMGITLMNTIRWNISASAVNAVTGEFQKMYYFAKDLDRSLTNIRIVSGQSAENMRQFAVEANASAKALKTSTIEYTDAATLFYQQGLKGQDVTNMTDAAIMGANITGQTAEEMADLLTSVMNGYKIATEDVLDVVDKLAAVGATTAADFYELSTAMSKVASVANAAGVPLDELNAQLATIVSVTRESPESIGTSLKTVYGRMLAFKTDTKALMKDEDGEEFGVPNVEMTLKSYNKMTGAQISLFKTTADGKEELRDLGEVINEIGDSWDKTENKSAKFGLATALAGSKQQNRLISLFDAWDQYKEAVTTSMDSEGTALEQNEIKMESYEGRIKGLQAQKEELYMSFTDTDILKGFITGLTKATELLTNIVSTAGGLSGIIGAIGAVIASSQILKLSEVAGKVASIPGDLAKRARPQEGTEEELKIAGELRSLKKIYGEEEVQRQQKAKTDAQASIEFLTREAELLEKERDLRVNAAELGKEKGLSNDQRAKELFRLQSENDELKISNEEVKVLHDSYRDLENAKNAVLSAEGKISASGMNEQLKNELANAKAWVAEAEKAIEDASVDLGNKKVELEQARANLSSVEDRSKKVDSDYEAKVKNAKELERVQSGLQAGMLMLIPMFKTATDTSSSWMDMLKTGLLTVSPMVPKLVSGFAGLAPAIGAAVGPMAKLGVVASSTMGPMVLVIGAIAALGIGLKLASDNARKFERSMEDMADAIDKASQADSEYEEVNRELETGIELRKELLELKEAEGLTRGQEAELSELERVNERLRVQRDIKREIKEDADREAAEAAYKTSQQTTTQSDFQGWNETKVQEDSIEVMERLVKKYKESQKSVDDYSKAVEEATKKWGANSIAHKMAQRDLDAVTRGSDNLKKSLMEQIEANQDIVEGLGNNESKYGELMDTMNERIILSLEEIGIIVDTTEAIEELNEVIVGSGDAAPGSEEHIEYLNSLNEAYKEAKVNADNLREENARLAEIQAEVESGQALSIDTILELNETYGLTLDQVQLVVGGYEIEEEVLNDLMETHGLKTANAIADEIRETGTAMEQIRERIRGYQNEIKALQELAKARGLYLNSQSVLAKGMGPVRSEFLWEQDYDEQLASNPLSLVGTTKEQFVSNRRKAADVMQAEMDRVNKEHQTFVKDETDKVNKLLEDSYSELEGLVQDSNNRAKKKKDKKGRGSTKKEKEAYKAQVDIYERLNYLMEENSILLEMNRLGQERVSHDYDEHLKQMEREEELLKDRQTLLGMENDLRREELNNLQYSLDKAGFNFEGSIKEGNVMITNLGHIADQGKEVEEKFRRFLELKKEIPATSHEWGKLRLELERIESVKIDMMFEQISKRMSKFTDAIAELNYQLEFLDDDDFAGKMELNDLIIQQNTDSLVQLTAEIERASKETYPEGSAQLEKHSEKMKEQIELQKELTLAIHKDTKAREKNIEAERKRLLQAHIDGKNEELRKQRERVQAMDETQDKIVAIIQKRGEKEREVAQQAHEERMKLLEEESEKRRTNYEEDLNSFRKLIEGKIQALEDQYKEEDYLEALEKEREEATRIQKEIDLLSLDSSLSGKNRTIKLKEELAKQNEKIVKMQNDKERENIRKSLEDQLKNYEENANEKEKIAEESSQNEIDIERERYEAQLKEIESSYENHKVYAEARAALRSGEVRDIEGNLVSITDAIQDFEYLFGKSAGILRDHIQEDIIDMLALAAQAIKDFEYEERVRKDYDIDEDDFSDEDIGFSDPGELGGGVERPYKHPLYMSWSDEDYSAYIRNKEMWGMGEDAWHDRSVFQKENERLRKKYGMKDDVGLGELRGYKDGGVIDQTGLAVVHGSQTSSEVAFSASTAKKLWDYIERLPKIGNVSSTGFSRGVGGGGVNSMYDIDINVSGNLDRSLLPEVEGMITSAIETAEFEKRKDLEKMGISKSLF